jgi:hypothetical protein
VRLGFGIRGVRSKRAGGEKVVYIELALAKRTDGQQTTGDEVKGKSHHQN